jgi:hypothetical protein
VLKTHAYTEIFIRIFLVALFIMPQKEKESSNIQLKNTYINAVYMFNRIKVIKNKELIHAITWINYKRLC